MSTPDSPQLSPALAAWHAQRRAAVTAPAGNLALVEYLPVSGTVEPEAVPGLVAELAPGREGVFLTPPVGDVMAVDGVPATARTFVNRLRADGTPLVRVGRFTVDVFSLDGTDYELRIYDPESEALAVFSHIEAYPEDPAAVFVGRFRAFEGTQQVAWGFTRESDTGHTKQVPRQLDVEIDGVAYQLLAFLNGPQMVLVYSDATSGKESYAPGKFLAVPAPAEDGTVELDFNRSFIPPCGFSYSYSCPIPPAQNRISAPLRAGEKKVVFTDGR